MMMLCDAVKSSPVYCLRLAFSAGAVVRETAFVKQKAWFQSREGIRKRREGVMKVGGSCSRSGVAPQSVGLGWLVFFQRVVVSHRVVQQELDSCGVKFFCPSRRNLWYNLLQLPIALPAEGHCLDDEEAKYLCFPFNHCSLILRELIEKMRLGRSKPLVVLLRVTENWNLKNWNIKHKLSRIQGSEMKKMAQRLFPYPAVGVVYTVSWIQRRW